MKIRSIRLFTAFLFMMCITAAVAVAMAEEVPPYDYSSFEGTWYNSTEDMHLYVYMANGNKIHIKDSGFLPTKTQYILRITKQNGLNTIYT